MGKPDRHRSVRRRHCSLGDLGACRAARASSSPRTPPVHAAHAGGKLRRHDAGVLGNFGLFYVNGSLPQYVHGFSVPETGLGIMPMIIPLLVLPRFVPRIVDRFGIAPVLGFAFSVVSIGLFPLSVNTATSYLVYAPSLFVTVSYTHLTLPTSDLV